MSIKCQQIISWIEELAPKKLAVEWDNVGLQLGDPAWEVNKVLVSLDLNQQVVDEAVELGANLIVCHHPYIFKPLKTLRSDLPQGRVITNMIKHDIALYVAHTNWDVAVEGVNQVLGKMLSLEEGEVLKVTAEEKLYKLAVFVPLGYEEAVRDGLAKGGAGYIGNYSNCTFMVEGTGTFMPEAGTNPFIGTQGKLEQVQEKRLETIVPQSKLKSAIKAMIKAHPYEEVAYDVVPLDNNGMQFGLGLMGKLAVPCSLSKLVQLVKEKLGVGAIKVVGPLDTMVTKIAVCGGSGGDMISAAAFKGAQVLITGDVSYHQAQNAEATGICIIDAGHFATEAPAMVVLGNLLQQRAHHEKRDISIEVSKIKTDPWIHL